MLLWFSSMASSLPAAGVAKFPELRKGARDWSQGCIPALKTYRLRRAGRPPTPTREAVASMLERQCQRRGGSFDARTRDRQDSTSAWAAPRASYLVPRAAQGSLAAAHSPQINSHSLTAQQPSRAGQPSSRPRSDNQP